MTALGTVPTTARRVIVAARLPARGEVSDTGATRPSPVLTAAQRGGAARHVTCARRHCQLAEAAVVWDEKAVRKLKGE